MASGNKNVQFNTRERAISTDMNRLQKFANADYAELFRYLMDVSIGRDDIDAAGVTQEYNGLEAPLRAEIINGLLVRPQVGSVSVLVDPGVLYAIAPDSDPDSSNYKYVHDAGVTSLSALSIGANASGLTRIDVIECQVTSNIVETDNRDIYNGSTGLFSPTTVTKAVANGLTYRVRAGTAGAGYPGHASGWLPLCIASVPTGTTNNDTVTFWDVRPVLVDRVFSPYNADLDGSRVRRLDVYGDIYSSGGKNLLRGNVDIEMNLQPDVGTTSANNNAARRGGGRLRRGSPGADIGNTGAQVGITDQVDLLDVTNQDPGFITPGSGLTYVYLAFPLGLPRWARYTLAGASGRVPRSPRGIIALSNVPPIHGDTKPSSQLNVPTVCGFGSGGFTSAAALIAVVPYTGSAPAPTSIRNGKQLLASPLGTVASSPTSTMASSTFTLTENTHFPANAKTLILQLQIEFSMLNGSIVNASPFGGVAICDPFTGAAAPASQIQNVAQQWTNNSGITSNGTYYTVVCEVPVPSHYPGVTFLQSYKIVWSTGLSATVGSNPTFFTNGTCSVLGWTF